MPKIEIIEGSRKGESVDLSRQVTLIGRTKECEIFLDDYQVSRKHAKIFQKDGRMYILDLGSRNGTIVNGKRINEIELTPYCEIRIGSSILRYEVFAELDDQGNIMEPILTTRNAPVLDITKIDIKGYDIVEMIGRGGMGYVCKARQISMDRVVAIKILNEKFSNNPAFVARFISEARAAGKLNHPNVIQVHDVGQYNNIYFFSMELLEGKTVLELLREKKHIAIADAIYYTIETAKALEYAHRLGIIHQDVKPDNIMVTTANQVKLADLGISKVYDGNNDVIENNEVMGSPHFMSPEQALGKQVDGRSDIYSLGVALFQMLASDTPFSGVSIQEILKKHVSAPTPSVRDINPKIPSKLAAIVFKMMQKEPDDRFRSATEVIDSLQPIYDKLVPKKGGAKAKLELRKLAKEHVSKSAKKKAIVFIGASILVLIVAISLAFAFSGNDDPVVTPITSGGEVMPSDSAVDSPPTELNILYQKFLSQKDSDIYKARDIGTEILSKFADFEGSAQRYVQKVQTALQGIDRKIAEEEISDLSSKYNQLISDIAGVKPEKILESIRKFIDANKKVLDKYSSEIEIKTIRSDLKRRESDAIKAREASLVREFNEMKKSVLSHIASYEFNLADHKLEQFFRLHDEGFKKEIRDLRDMIVTAELDHYNDTLKQAEEVARKSKLSLAMSILREFLRDQSGRKFADKVRKKLELYSEQLEKVTASLLLKGEEYEKDFDFDSARKEYEKLASQVTYDQEKLAKVTELLYAVQGEYELMTNLIQVISAKAPIQLTADITGKMNASQIRNWQISKANENKITVTNKGGVSQAFRWKDIPGEGIDKLITAIIGTVNDRRKTLGFARILRLKGLVERADELVAAAPRN